MVCDRYARGILIAAGVASIFGVSLDILPVVILLVLLAVYDAISVYKTKHMITLAEGVIDLKTPILFVIPKRRDYSFIRDGIGKLEEGGERAAFIIGMGDLIMPSILVVSANVFIKGWRLLGIINLPALGAIIGSLAGLAGPAFICCIRKTPGRAPAPERRHYSGFSCGGWGHGARVIFVTRVYGKDVLRAPRQPLPPFPSTWRAIPIRIRKI